MGACCDLQLLILYLDNGFVKQRLSLLIIKYLIKAFPSSLLHISIHPFSLDAGVVVVWRGESCACGLMEVRNLVVYWREINGEKVALYIYIILVFGIRNQWD